MNRMSHDRFHRVRELFDAAVELDPANRTRFVEQAAGSDAELRGDVQRLLIAHSQTSRLAEAVTLTPQEIDGYEVIRKIADGGAAAVYLVRREGQSYALKLPLRAVLDPEMLRRFRRECGVLMSLDHPNIARFISVGRSAHGVPYMVMEYVEGQPIDIWCDECGMPGTAAVKLVFNLCSAVQYAHDLGIIHRDLKPPNVLVTSAGTPKLLDFGIVKLYRRGGAPQTSFGTPEGLRLLTPAFGTPEQVNGAPVSAATDVYSLCLILYRLLARREPYKTTNGMIHEYLAAILEQNLSPLSVNSMPGLRPGGVRRLNAILGKGTQKDPRNRFQSVTQLQCALGEF